VRPTEIAIMKWSDCPNLRLRPHSPNKGRGRLQVQIRRAWIASGATELSSEKIYDWCYTRRRTLGGKPITTRHRYSVWRVLKAMGATPIGRVGPHHATLWKLPDEVAKRWR